MIRKISSKSFFSVFLIIFFTISNAQGDDQKVYPGSMCVVRNNLKVDGNEVEMPDYEYSAIGNPSSSDWLNVDCPVVHDILHKNVRSGWVQMIDTHYNYNISCRFYSIFRSGRFPYGWASGRLTTTGSTRNVQTKGFGAVRGSAGSHYYLSCSIPPKYGNSISYIVTYNVSEDN